VPLTDTPPASVITINLPTPRELPEDAPDNHDVVGKGWLLGASELLEVLEEMNSELADITAPAGFGRMSYPRCKPS
jgi:hypothetical protein